jgi:ribulose-5-phosphate 4-epimerase/fuculose-1-phosphate aldolase
MTPNYVEHFAQHMGLHVDRPDYQAAMDLIAHTRELHAFILDLTDHLVSTTPTPDTTAAHFQILKRAYALRELIQPPHPKQ